MRLWRTMQRFLWPLFASLGLLVLLGCSGKNPDDALSQNCAVERTPVGRFSLCLPDEWEYTRETMAEKGSVIVFIQSPTSEGALMQIHIKKDPLQEPVRNTKAFAERAVQLARKTAPDYKAISTDPLLIGRKKTILHIFEALPAEGADPIRYYQFVTVHEGIAYGFTAVMFPEAEEELQQTLLGIFTNVRFI